MKLVKRQVQQAIVPIITIEYDQWNEELESIYGFIEGKYKTITAYSEDKELVNLRIDKILYFEAVGEHVFAYTKNNMYEIKMRLYQIEPLVEQNKIYRASKSILVNVRKIAAMKPALNGRLYAHMINDEDILVSRAYAKNILEYIKNL